MEYWNAEAGGELANGQRSGINHYLFTVYYLLLTLDCEHDYDYDYDYELRARNPKSNVRCPMIGNEPRASSFEPRLQE